MSVASISHLQTYINIDKIPAIILLKNYQEISFSSAQHGDIKKGALFFSKRLVY